MVSRRCWTANARKRQAPTNHSSESTHFIEKENVQLQHVGIKVLQQDFIGIGSEASSKQGAEGLHLKKKYIL